MEQESRTIAEAIEVGGVDQNSVLSRARFTNCVRWMGAKIGLQRADGVAAVAHRLKSDIAGGLAHRLELAQITFAEREIHRRQAAIGNS